MCFTFIKYFTIYNRLESLQRELAETKQQAETLGDLASSLRHQSEEREADTSLERHRAYTQTAETVALLEAKVDEAMCSSENLQTSLVEIVKFKVIEQKVNKHLLK